MSKFEELCKSYATARENYFNYRNACWDFASHLVSGMIDYFQCPKEQVKFIPLKGDEKPGSVYTLMGAMHLDDDTFWHLGVGLTLYIAPNVFPHETILLPLLIKKVTDYFIVKLDGHQKEFKIHIDKTDEFDTFYEFVFQQIQETYEKGLQRFLDQNEATRKIGFT